MSFETAECFAAGLAFGLFAFEVGLCGWVDAALGDGDAVQGAVELAVAAAVEAVAPVFAGAGVERCDAGVAGELRIRAEAVDWSDLAQQLGGGESAAAGQFEQPRRERGSLVAITITGGSEVSGEQRKPNVPKRDLIATTSLILEQRRIRIAENMTHTEALLDELLAYRRVTSERGTDSYGAPSGLHDDLVLALSLALWTAENRPPAARRYPIGNPNNLDRELPSIDDMLGQAHRRNFNF